MTCTRRIQFCAGHRVHNHESKCRNLHGHNYVALFTARAKALDDLGRVIDFAALKERLGGWIDRHWDHGFVLYQHDYKAIEAVNMVADQKLYVMPSNPTAENMADHLLRAVAPLALDGTNVEVVAVRLWETENCYADATL